MSGVEQGKGRRYTKDMAVRISALLDIVFKYIFGSTESTRLLKDFINAVQKDSGFLEVESVHIENPFNDKTYQDEKLSIIDVRATDKKGNWYNIEVQLQSQPYFPERSLYYWAKTYANQLEDGKEYMQLNKVISINLMGFTRFPDYMPFHSCFLLHEKENTDYVLTTDLILHYLEIPKMEDILDTDLRKWLYFLRHAGEEDEKMKVLLENDYMFREADKRYKQFASDRRARMAANARDMFLHDQANRIWGAKHEGKREVAQNMLKEGMETALIARVTGLSEEEIMQL